MNYNNWWMAQFLNMSEEKQDEMMEENAAAEAMDDTMVRPMDDTEEDIVSPKNTASEQFCEETQF